MTVQTDPVVEFHLREAEGLCREASVEVDRAVERLTGLGVSAQDIVTLLAGRALRAEPSRPLVPPNAQDPP